MYDLPPMQIPSREADIAEVRAMVYALLSNGWRYPDESLVNLFGEREDWGRWPKAIEGLSSDVTAQIRNLREACSQTYGRSRLLNLEQLLASYGRLFGHSVRGSCPLYELEYGHSEIIQQTAELADLAGFYNAFGMSICDSAFERADHVAVECEFLSVLCVKEAWGQQQGDSELTETCVDAQRLFLRDHLARWMPAFSHRVMKADPEGLYGRLGALAETFLMAECRRFDIEAGPQWLELRPIDPARDAAIDCDTAECGVVTANQLVQISIESQANGEHRR